MSPLRRRRARLSVAALAVAALVAGPAGSASADEGEVVGGPALGTSGFAVDAPGATPLPRLTAASYLLADIDSGEILAAHNPHGRLRPASTLKLLTAITVMPRLAPDTVYTGRFEDANAEGSKVGIVPDGTYTVQQLWQGLFLMSGNDAASALANAAGGVTATVAAMNATAKRLGALDTTARNPSGLDARGQFSSAYDLTLFARAGMRRPDFRAYAATVRAQFPGKMPKAGHPRKTFQIYTQDRLLLNYRGAIGIKTGWTTKARGTFVGAATRNGRTLVATVLRSHFGAWSESRALLDWGFRNASLARPVGTLNPTPKTQAVALPGPGKGVSGGAVAAPSGGGGASLPLWAWIPLFLLSAVVALRTRVLVRRRRRRLRRPAVRHPAVVQGRTGLPPLAPLPARAITPPRHDRGDPGPGERTDGRGAPPVPPYVEGIAVGDDGYGVEVARGDDRYRLGGRG
jgi:D-alanyl-D-alanine carboxypeptidase (penicillin-binding protein 5/6)